MASEVMHHYHNGPTVAFEMQLAQHGSASFTFIASVSEKENYRTLCSVCVWGKKNPPTTHPHTLSYCADKPFTVHLFMIIH